VRCDRDQFGAAGLHRATAVTRDAHIRAEPGLRRRRAKAHERLGLGHLNLGVEPRQARRDLTAIGSLVNPALPRAL
jgi:hypothetical protein